MSRAQHLKLVTRLNYTFSNPDLLLEALHHASAKKMMKNERLEFLGDRVLGLVIAEYLYKSFQLEEEGDMAKRLSVLVSRESCALVARQYQLSEAIVFDKGSRQNSATDNVLANVCEAVIAAIYLDGGLEPARIFILQAWQKIFDEMVDVPVSAKSALQEYTVAQGLGMPHYEIVSQQGPAHKPVITVRIQLEAGQKTEASDSSRKKAENIAAEKMLAKLKED